MFAASSSVYGGNGVPWVETMPPLPQSPYAATKLAGEGLLRAYASPGQEHAHRLGMGDAAGKQRNASIESETTDTRLRQVTRSVARSAARRCTSMAT